MRSVGIILLAAGGSVRMGRPKQLLPFRGTTLVRHAATTALATGHPDVVVVLGAEADACAAALYGLAVTLVRHAEWSQGMGSSLRAGIEALEKNRPGIEAALVLLHDQPLVSVPALHRLIELWQPPGRPIAAAIYGGKPGVPAVFDRSLFQELKALPAAEGAKKIIARHAAEVAALEMPEALDDIDSLQDYERIVELPEASVP